MRRLELGGRSHALPAVKENLGFVNNKGLRNSRAFNSLAFQERTGLGGGSNSAFALTDDKFRCQWAKDETATIVDTEDGPTIKISEDRETRAKKRESHAKSISWRKLRPKLYKTAVGASFCVVLGLCTFTVLPKLTAPRPVVVPYSTLVGGIRDGSVDRVQFVENSRTIFFNTKPSSDQKADMSQGHLQAGTVEATEDNKVINNGIFNHQTILANVLGKNKDSKPVWQHTTKNVDDDKYELLVLLKEQGITYGSDPELMSISARNIMIVVLQQMPYWVMVLLTCYQLSHQLSIGRNTSKKPSKKQSVTFDDVEGVDDAKTELLEIVSCMEGDSKYKKLGAKLPRGVLLAGPPGTGKTLLARAVAGEAGVSFFSISASELVEVYVGRGAARVRDLFREARKHSPSIIFIDEIDAVGGHRGRTLNCERDQTLNQLLTEMDGFEKDENVVVIAATNRPETLDSALLRPGRFSRKVTVGEPDEDGRRKIFGIYLKDVPMEEDKEFICDLVATLTPGLVGADLENIAHEAVLLAARRGGEFVSREDILRATERAKAKIYSSADEAKPFPFGSMTQDYREGDGGAIGFGTLG